MHVLEITEAFQFVVRNVNGRHILEVLAHVLWNGLDLIVSKVKNFDSFGKHPELLDFIVAQVEVLQEVE